MSSKFRIYAAMALSASTFLACGSDDPVVPGTSDPSLPDSIIIGFDELRMEVGDTITIGTEVVDQGGQPVESFTVQWTSSDETIAEVQVVGEGAAFIEAIARGTATLTAQGSVGSVELEATLPVRVMEAEAVQPLYVLDPCEYADSTAMWSDLGTVVAGSNTGPWKPTLDSTVSPVPWNGSCNRAFLHRWNTVDSEAQSAYDWTFGGSVGTTREVWYKIWVLMPDSLRVASDWKTMFLFTNNVNDGNYRYRVSWGHQAASYSAWQSQSISDSLDYGMQLTGLPVGGYQERGERPPKGEGRFESDGDHENNDAPSMTEIAFAGEWKEYCVYNLLPLDAPDDTIGMKVWVDGELLNDSDSSAVIPTAPSSASLDQRYFSKFSFGRNGELFFVDPAVDTIVRESAYLHSGRVQIYNRQPSEGCGG